MKAITVREFGGPEVMKLEEGPDQRPGEGQVLVRLKAAGVNPVDTYIRSGVYAKKPPLPYVPGSDGAGTVEEAGPDCPGIKAGDRVYIEGALTGTYAETCLVDRSRVHPLPEGVSFSQGAALGVPYATAHRALFGRASAVKGETVLVHGASGGVGTAAVQLAKAAGLTVIGTAGSEKGLELVERLGADHVLDHKSGGYMEEIMKLTGGRGVDVILEMAAHLNLGKDLGLLGRGGRVVVIGSRGPVEVNPRELMGKEAAVLGMLLFNASLEELSLIHQELANGLADGSLAPVVGEEVPLAEASRAHEAVLRSGASGKIVLVP